MAEMITLGHCRPSTVKKIKKECLKQGSKVTVECLPSADRDLTGVSAPVRSTRTSMLYGITLATLQVMEIQGGEALLLNMAQHHQEN